MIALVMGAVLSAALLVTPSNSGAAPKTCYSCHKDAETRFKRKNQHAPVARQDCEACHIRHGFSNMLILKAEGTALCTPCHKDFESRLAGGAHVHPAVGEGLCATCHNPHASDLPGLMRQVDGDLACFVCHTTLVDSSGTAKSHKPFAARECGRCHEDHSSAHAGLLIDDETTLCAGCHDPGKSQKAHTDKGLTTAGLPCSGCHDPHLSKQTGLLSPLVHEPVTAGLCDACHTGVPVPPATLGAADSTWAGCSACHDDIGDKLAQATPHAPAEAGDCHVCHTAHKSSRPQLLKAGVAELCQSCHDDMSVAQLASSVSIHQPVRVGDCSSCHDSHGSRNPALLVRVGNALCTGCHDAAKFTQSHHLEITGSECMDCHLPHASSQHALLRSSPRATCANCHTPDLTPGMAAHEPVEKGECARCHDPHDGPGTLLQKEPPSLCFDCHQNIARFTSATFKHDVAEDCTICHGAHEAPSKGLLLKAGSGLCSDCHDTGRVSTARSVHAPFEKGDCAGCHNPHGSQFAALLGPRRQMVGTPVGPILTYPKLDTTAASLCRTCHQKEMETWTARTVQHLPAANGECSACHTAHQSEHAGLLRAATGAICQTCHDPSAIPPEPHLGINLASADCGQCHDPHASNQKWLLKANAHPPFADGSCDACHTGSGSLTLSTPQPELCFTCHDDLPAQLQQRVSHPPAAGGSCTECHSPHASNELSLLTARTASLCGSCHDETAGKHRHQPYDQGECTTCHAPHGSANPALLTKGGNTLCLECHTALAERLRSERPHAAVEEGCLVCHTGHASDNASLLNAPASQRCGSCHDTKTDRWRAAHVVPGTDGTGGDCMSCHDPHASPANATAMLKRSQHRPFEERECRTCHSTGRPLARSSRDLCGTCHSDVVASIGAFKVAHAPVTGESGCTTCHSPHVGDTPALLRKTGFSVCTDCHKSISLSAPFVHAPAKEDCAICHTPHGGDNSALLVDADPMSLCTACHEDAAKTHFHPMGDRTKKPENRGLIVCTSCHSPHNSQMKALLLGDPTRGLCVRCHDPSAAHNGG